MVRWLGGPSRMGTGWAPDPFLTIFLAQPWQPKRLLAQKNLFRHSTQPTVINEVKNGVPEADSRLRADSTG